MATSKRFFVNWSSLYLAYCVFDSKRKNPEGNVFMIHGTDNVDRSATSKICDELNNGSTDRKYELYEQYGIPSIATPMTEQQERNFQAEMDNEGESFSR